MSAPNRKPALGEHVHVAGATSAGKLTCRAGIVTNVTSDFEGAVEVFTFIHPPEYLRLCYDESRAYGTFHFEH